MDTVILAAGRGSRLDGIAAPFHKPLLVVNGKPLIRQCVELADEAAGGGSIIIVAAPENAAPISHVLNGAGHGRVDIIIQREPKGPGHALLTGLKLVTTNDVLVLLGDNVVSAIDVERVVEGRCENVIGVSNMPLSEAQRFTRLRHTSDGQFKWVEKVPVTEDDDPHEAGTAVCWVGPVKLNASKMEKAIRADISSGGTVGREIPIGPLFNKLGEFSTMQVTSIDIGVPEAL